MKLVVAIIRPDRLNNVLEELFNANVAGLTISRVQGHGGEMERVETYRGMNVKMELTEKVRIEIGVSDHFVDPTISAICAGARTGEVGDGKIFVMPVDRVVRIRTGEEDRAAVTPVGVPADLGHSGIGAQRHRTCGEALRTYATMPLCRWFTTPTPPSATRTSAA